MKELYAIVRFFIITIVFVCTANAQESGDTVISIHKENATLVTILEELEAKSGYSFGYTDEIISDARLFSLSYNDTKLSVVLKKLSAIAGIEFKTDDHKIIVKKQKKRDVTGTIRDTETGEPLVGATVLVKGSNPLVAVQTDADGKFSIPVNTGDEIEIRFVGYKTQTIKASDKSAILIAMEIESNYIDPVIAIGYGQIKRMDATGSVAVVSQEEIGRLPVSSVDKAIQGFAPGVLITSTGGDPEQAPSINVRGIGSIYSSSQPMIIVDGISNYSINDIAPQDIDQVTILKDASATAIYGARGANGVILITTRRGTRKKPTVSLSAYTGFSEFAKQLNIMNADQYSGYIRTLHKTAGDLPASWAYTSDSARDANRYSGERVNTNWQKELTRQHAPVRSYNLAVNRGGDKCNFNIGGNYYDEDGTLINRNYKRYGMRANSDLKISDWIKIGETLNITKTESSKGNTSLINSLTASPLMPVYNNNNPDGYQQPEARYCGVGGTTNPVAEAMLNTSSYNSTRFISDVYSEITPTIIKGLKYRFDAGYINTFLNSNANLPDYINNSGTPFSIMRRSNSETNYWQINNLVTYNRSFGEESELKEKPHNLTVLVGHEARSFQTGSGTMLYSTRNTDGGNVVTTDSTTKPVVSDRMYSYLFRTMYNYKSKYYITASLRNDNSVRFPPKNRSGWFPSFALGWNFNEDFLKDFKDIISMSKLRFGWGKIGNDNIGNFAYQAALDPSLNSRYVFGSTQVVQYGAQIYSSSGNPDLKWEAASMTNMGLDLSLFKNKFQFTAEYYIKNQHNIIVRMPTPYAAGLVSGAGGMGPLVNLGDMQNRGFEFSATYRKSEGDFNYHFSANLTTYHNIVKKLPSGEIAYSPLGSAATITKEGYPIGCFYGYVCDGIFQNADEIKKHAAQNGAQPGDLKFRDLNKDGKIDADDRTVIGKPIPDFSYGFSFDCSWKGFDLYLFLQGVQNLEIYNQTRATLLGSQNLMDQNKLADAMNYWSPDNTGSGIPRIDKQDINNNSRISTYWLENGSFLRLRNIQVGYTLPSKWTNKVKISRTRVYLSGTNLFTFTKYKGYDPEVGSMNPLLGGFDYGFNPTPKVYTAGVQIEF